ncbi:hypothetical protein J5226_10145 [Lysobacter sp. K5869]|uniref:hypothetical protein n=1 Tax=Lysobacter sp. K5869 TaxID=2820808 RepID=UPI001C064182|nr:hypothetical protein [Lysobacter sp. K5869]QWP78724.1 hypothetical protein J5226_10145 [Lysobacter sp. K5869]
MRTKRSCCEPQVRSLCRQWLLAVYEAGRPVEPEGFEDFYAWLARLHPEYLHFKPARTVVSWVSFWFEQECGRLEVERVRSMLYGRDQSENS